MDDIIAVEVTLTSKAKRYFLTFGRIFDVVDCSEIESLILKHAVGYALGGRPKSARVCYSLREAADTSDAPYFYECFLRLIHEVGKKNTSSSYAKWRARKKRELKAGYWMMYCGNPSGPGSPWAKKKMRAKRKR
jgi:hypothetical protein